MPTPVSRRTYRSPRRQEAARDTRRAVLDAAHRQFIAHGYGSTSLASIAEAAGVSLATVKLIAGTKARLLSAVIHALTRRDAGDKRLVEQPWWQEVLAEPDPRRLVDKWTAVASATLETQSELFEVLWEAAPSEPELARLEREGSQGRWRDVRQVVATLKKRGALRRDLDTDGATDTAWAVASPQLYRLLVGRRGWSARRWEVWLRDILSALLLSG